MKLNQQQIDAALTEIQGVSTSCITAFQAASSLIKESGMTDELTETMTKTCRDTETAINTSMKQFADGLGSVQEFKSWAEKLHKNFSFNKAVAVSDGAKPGRHLSSGGI